MKFAALGRTQWLLDSIRLALQKGHKPVLIATCPAAPEYGATEQDFAKLAHELNCPYFCDTNINKPKYAELIRESAAEVAISVNWLTLIGPEIRGAFRYGVINAHAGDLPRFRGNAVVNWAILSGESNVVLTLHQMVAELDAGPIWLQRQIPITSQTYVGEIFQFLGQNIPTMFLELLNGIADGELHPRTQPDDPKKSLRCFPRLAQDSEIDWHSSAEQVVRLVRASAEPFAGAYTFCDGEKLIVWRARLGRLSYPYLGTPGQVAEIRRSTGEVAVLTSDGVCVLEEVQIPATARQRATDVIRSARTRLGVDSSGEITRLKTRVHELEERFRQLSR